MVRQGDVIAGKYRVQEVLGAGGMGYVVAALHEQLGQRVAIKLLSPNLCENEESVARFLREARAAVRIQSEHVARVLDVGELGDGSPYMVMELLSGRDLAEELDQPGQLEIPEAIDYVLQAAEAVAEAHALGLIHRDLKPSNLFLTRRPDGTPLVKVLDFGISKAIRLDDSSLEPQPSLTETHSLLGSPAYMSPEQIRRPKTVDFRTDIWSLGSILYELLAREAPFGADSPLALLAAVVSDPLPSIRELRPEVPRELEAVIARSLAKNPDERYQTVAELAEALAPFAPKSLPSVSRISGILRASLPPPVSGSAASSADPTLQSPLPSRPESDAGESTGAEVSARAPKVKVVTPFAHGAKSTKTTWESGAPPPGRSRRRALLAAAGALVLVVAGVVAWQLAGAKGEEDSEKSLSDARSSAAQTVEPEPSASERSASAPPAVDEPVAPPASAVGAAAPSSAASTTSTRPPAAAPKRAAPRSSPSAPAPASEPPKSATPPAPADPLDGRR